MNPLIEISAVVLTLGGIGGMASSLLSGVTDLFSSRSDDIFKPGIVVNATIGALAAMVIWGAYGADAGYNLFATSPDKVNLTLFQAVMSIPVGMSGGRILTTMAEKQADKFAKDSLSAALRKEQTRKISGKS